MAKDKYIFHDEPKLYKVYGDISEKGIITYEVGRSIDGETTVYMDILFKNRESTPKITTLDDNGYGYLDPPTSEDDAVFVPYDTVKKVLAHATRRLV